MKSILNTVMEIHLCQISIINTHLFCVTPFIGERVPVFVVDPAFIGCWKVTEFGFTILVIGFTIFTFGCREWALKKSAFCFTTLSFVLVIMRGGIPCDVTGMPCIDTGCPFGEFCTTLTVCGAPIFTNFEFFNIDCGTGDILPSADTATVTVCFGDEVGEGCIWGGDVGFTIIGSWGGEFGCWTNGGCSWGGEFGCCTNAGCCSWGGEFGCCNSTVCGCCCSFSGELGCCSRRDWCCSWLSCFCCSWRWWCCICCILRRFWDSSSCFWSCSIFNLCCCRSSSWFARASGELGIKLGTKLGTTLDCDTDVTGNEQTTLGCTTWVLGDV